MPERDLIASVLSRALMDLSSRWEDERKEALDWIEDSSVRAMSFLWVVKALGLEVSSEEIRTKARKEYHDSVDYYEHQFKTEGRPWRTRIFQLP